MITTHVTNVNPILTGGSKPLPHSPTCERGLIASLLVAPKYFPIVAADLDWHDFVDPGLGRLYETLRMMNASNMPVDDLALTIPFLKAAGLPEDLTTAAFFASLIGEGVPSNCRYYALEIRKASTHRKVIGVAADTYKDAHDPRIDPSQLIEDVCRKFDEIQRPLSAKIETIGEAGERLIGEMRCNRITDASRGTMSGLVSLDTTCGAMMPGELTILAARPGVGKTALAMQIAKHAAEKSRHVLVASLEMASLELAMRVVCGIGKVNSRRFRTGKISQGDEQKIVDAVHTIRDLPIHIFAPASASFDNIRTAAGVVKTKNELRLIIVDYIGLVTPADKREPRHEQVARVSRSLKILAKECECPVLALCQLNRDADGNRPRLSNLRESGSIEQDADVVLFLHRQDEAKKNDITLYVEKHRHAEPMMTALRFVPEETRFIDPRSFEERKENSFDAFNERAF